VIKFATVTIHNLGEIAAKAVSAPIFAVHDDIAVIGTAAPLVTLSDRAVEASIVCPLGIGTVLAIHVAGQRITGKTAKKCAPHNPHAVAVAEHPSENRSEHASGNGTAGVTVSTAGIGEGIVHSKPQNQDADANKIAPRDHETNLTALCAQTMSLNFDRSCHVKAAIPCRALASFGRGARVGPLKQTA
jgi:hypothetical protein